MKQRTFIFIASAFVALLGAFLIPPVVAQNTYPAARTTAWSRQFLTNTTAAGALATIGAVSFRDLGIGAGATITIHNTNKVESLGGFWTMAQDETITLSTNALLKGTELFLQITADGSLRQVTLDNSYFKHPDGGAGAVFKIKAGKTVMLKFISDGTYFNEVDGREPRGQVKMWSSTIASIPDGWVLCDGGSGSPDLRNRFVVAADADDGGVAKTTIVGAAAQTGGSTSHGHSVSATTADFLEAAGTEVYVSAGFAIDSTTTVPPFYALAYIFKL